MIISAIICTHNRAEYLGKAIQSLIDQSLDKKDYEILVIDNASTDKTKEICSKFNEIIYVYEPKLGLSHARNTGLKKAKGRYIAYLDDDAIASKDWLKNIIKTFENNKKIVALGGKIEPIWESTRPKWLSDGMLGMLAVVDWGNKSKFLKDDEWIAGANIAFNKQFLEDSGGFDINLGRKGKNLLSMEETLLFDKIKDKGYKIYYDTKK